jgi:hypothetical protein
MLRTVATKKLSLNLKKLQVGKAYLEIFDLHFLMSYHIVNN